MSSMRTAAVLGVAALFLCTSLPVRAQWDECNPGEEEAFSAGPYGTGYYDTADDFTLPVLDGAGQPGASFTYSDLFPGCENVVFFGYLRNSCYAVYSVLAEPEVLFEESPRNVHYVFMSFESDPSRVLEDMGSVRDRYEEALATLPQAEQDFWRPRLHYVTDSARSLPGWLSTFVNNTFFVAHPYFGWGIDRRQRIRNIGMTQDPAQVIECVPGDPNSRTWFPRTSHLANEPRYWNFEWNRERTLAQETFTELPVWQEQFAGNIYADLVLPSAAEMASYDTMLFDMELLCYDRNNDGTIDNLDCEWDYLIHAYICDPEDPNVCNEEIGRWITTYGRDGRWVVDVSPMLAFLRDGGPQRLRFYSQNGYDIDFRILLADRGDTSRPYSTQFLYSGGIFNLDYNPNHPPKQVSIPSYATSTALAATITGHGFGDAANCAEFCDHQHVFTFDGSPYIREHPMTADVYGCKKQIDQELGGYSGPGTVPNQFGTWVYGRGGWCPGLEVKPWVVDITGDVVPGQETRVTYQGLYQGQDYDPQPGSGGGFSARINMTSRLVHYIDKPEGDCADGTDDDGDGDVDCADDGCWAAANCIDQDVDGDGVLHPDDCDPLDGGVFDAPGPLDRIFVAKDTGVANQDAVLSWNDLAATAGDATRYDVVSGRLGELAADGSFLRADCQRGLDQPTWTDQADAGGNAGFYYFARARNFCGRTDFGRNAGNLCN